jgi:hypothetical protein
VVTNANVATQPDVPVPITLTATDVDGDPLTLRIVSQPGRGTVGLVGTTATCFPEPGFVGSAKFTFAANDGKTDSNLGYARVVVGTRPACGIGAELALVLVAMRGRRRSCRGRNPTPHHD